jgi:conjugative transfer region protein TrbK
MGGALLARLGAVIFVAIAGTAAVVEMSRKEKAPEPSPSRTVGAAHDPLREGLRRCQQLGETAANTAECLRVWADSRDRFLGRPASMEGR